MYKYYVSAESHPKSNFPKLWYAVGLLPIFLMFGGYKYTMDFFAPKETTATVPVVQNELPKQPLLNADNQQKDLKMSLCRSAVNLDKPECKKYIQEITNKGLSIAPVNVYDPAKPYGVEYTVQDFEPKDFPRFKNAIVYNGKCTTYSQQKALSCITYLLKIVSDLLTVMNLLTIFMKSLVHHLLYRLPVDQIFLVN